MRQSLIQIAASHSLSPTPTSLNRHRFSTGLVSRGLFVRAICNSSIAQHIEGNAQTSSDSLGPTSKTLTIVIGLEGFKQPKVPTILSYDPNQKTSFTWGAQKHKHAKIEGMKLLLDPGQETPLYIPETNTAAELKKLGKPATDVVTDYITAIYKHALNRIETKIPAEYLKMCQKKFVVTVPAVWSAKAMNATLLVSPSTVRWDLTLRYPRLQNKRAFIRCR